MCEEFFIHEMTVDIHICSFELKTQNQVKCVIYISSLSDEELWYRRYSYKLSKRTSTDYQIETSPNIITFTITCNMYGLVLVQSSVHISFFTEIRSSIND